MAINRKLLSIALGGLLSLTAISTVQAVDEVRLGTLYPITGSAALAGGRALAAVKAVVDIVNNYYDLDIPLARTEGLPNLGGAKIKLIVADPQGKPEIGRAEAERLIDNEKVVALFGAYHSSVSAAASNVAERRGIPYLTGESSSPKLHTRGFKWFFRTGPHDGHYTKTMFDFIRDFQKNTGIEIKTAAIMHEDTQFGVDSAREQVRLCKENGIEVVAKIAYRAKTPSLTAEIQLLKAANADVFFPTSYEGDAILTVKTMKELGYTPKLWLAQNAGYNQPGFAKAVGVDAEGIISRSPFSMDMAERIPLVGKINEIYKKHSGVDIFDPPIRTFVGALVLIDAINRAGSTDPEKIRDALRATRFPASAIPMPWNDIEFGPDGQNNGISTALIQMQNGTYYSVYPFEVAAKEVIYPKPAL